MILINLLPHREAARHRARQAFNVLLVLAMAVGAVMAGVVYLGYQQQISTQQSRNDLLTSENKKLDEQIKEIAGLQSEIAALKARQQAVEELQSNRNLPVHLMNDAVRQLPEGIFLNGIRQEGRNVLFTGVAQSSERVSELLRNLSRRSEWLKNPELIEIVASDMEISPRDRRRVYNFTVRVQLQQASDVQAAKDAQTQG
ncbi:MAG: PilN domain-containing protein [Burkholderiaceae bacterium]|nr:PilN domain-containing protein [Burkholderiaceae bacterium]